MSWALPEKFHYTTWTGQRTIAAIDKAHSQGIPFFIWSSYHDPHPPYCVPEPWASMYDPDDMEVGRYIEGEFEHMPPPHKATREADASFEEYDIDGFSNHGYHPHVGVDEDELRKAQAIYYGMISFMDHWIGQTLDRLEELGILDDTLILFSSDHGHFVGEHGLVAKGPFHYEDVIRVPLIAAFGDRIPSGVTSSKVQSLFDCAEGLGIRIPTSCRKKGKCRECMVEVSGGMEFLTPLHASEEHMDGALRLSCCARLLDDTGEVHCNTLKRGSIHIEVDAENLPEAATTIEVQPAVTRDGDTIYIEGKHVTTGKGPLLGAAIDVGTTTIVLRVYDLESGDVVAGTSFESPQRFGGSDIMARIVFDTSDGTKLLQRTLLGHLAHCLEDLPIDSTDIYEMVVAGNATMRDLFFGLDVESIGQKPYRSQTEYDMLEGRAESTVITATAKRLRLPLNPAARVYGLPLVGSHVGADTAACLLAIALMDEEKTVALMDIGTNTEIVCGNRHTTKAASCPAGPAFEGGDVSCGMPGLDGAIETIRLRDDRTVDYRVIGDTDPVGVCGSGLVDALSSFLKHGVMDHFGRYTDDSERFHIDRDHNLYLTEADISELAQAKGANVAGLNILLGNYGVTYDDLDVFYLAGGFARHLDIDAARRIGLIPDLPNEKIKKIGNAAIEGASIALYSLPHRRRLEAYVKMIGHVELETDPDFFEHFVHGCQFDYFQETPSVV